MKNDDFISFVVGANAEKETSETSETSETGKTATTTKHLGGKHDQGRHGHRVGADATPEQLAARRRSAASRAEAKRKPTGERQIQEQFHPVASPAMEAALRLGKQQAQKTPAPMSKLNPGRPLPDLEHAIAARDRIAQSIRRQDASITALNSKRTQMSSRDFSKQMDSLQKSRREMQRALHDADMDELAAKRMNDVKKVAAHNKMEVDRRGFQVRGHTTDVIRKIDDITKPKNDEHFVKLDDIRDRIDRMSKALGIEPIGPAHLRAGNAEASWKILKPAMTATLAAIRIRINKNAYDAGQLKTVSTFLDDIDAALGKM